MSKYFCTFKNDGNDQFLFNMDDVKAMLCLDTGSSFIMKDGTNITTNLSYDDIYFRWKFAISGFFNVNISTRYGDKLYENVPAFINKDYVLGVVPEDDGSKILLLNNDHFHTKLAPFEVITLMGC